RMQQLEADAQAARDGLTKENAEAVKQILENTDVAGLDGLSGRIQRAIGGAGSSIPGLYKGGTAYEDRPHVIGERGPEIFVPKVTGRVVSNRDAMLAIQQAISTQPQIATPFKIPTAPPALSAKSLKDMTVIAKSVKQIEKQLSSASLDTPSPTFNFTNWTNPDDEIFRSMKAMSRSRR
ncbi:MAG: hypothetical protein AAGA67_08510, partial [Cyanobacteria bacterium P01_F01_bin.153]